MACYPASRISLRISTLEWIFHAGAPLSIYSTPPFKIHPTAMDGWEYLIGKKKVDKKFGR